MIKKTQEKKTKRAKRGHAIAQSKEIQFAKWGTWPDLLLHWAIMKQEWEVLRHYAPYPIHENIAICLNHIRRGEVD